jgi:Asp-tRNA(Asn)/Glu-tRNA(Gln) amidotransferase A subunit family amidase
VSDQPSSSDLCELSVGEAHRLLRFGEISPVDLVQSSLDRITTLEPSLHAWVSIMGEEALAAAETAETELRSGNDRGALHGIPVAVKDIVDVAGIPTKCGSPVRDDVAPAAADAPVVAALRNAGAIVLGKTVTQEFAAGVVSAPARNPWNPARIPGGSSGGSAAAIAARVCPIAVGTDTGGSIRIPAAACGVVGLKPTYGRVSKRGVYPLAWSLDTVGPLAATVEDAALMLNAIAGFDPHDPQSTDEPWYDATEELDRDLRGLRIGVVRDHFLERVQDDIATAFELSTPVFVEQGAEVIDVNWPEAALARAAGLIINRIETVAVHDDAMHKLRDRYGEEMQVRVGANRLFPSAGYLRALKARVAIKRSIQRVFEENRLDAIIVPSLPGVASPADNTAILYEDGSSEPVAFAYTRLATVFNCTGQPALSLLNGFDRQGLPIGLTIAGRPFQEARICRIGAAFERATTFRQRRPLLIGD